mmetsp:Transcript_29156/g.93598  ORF Transcript_29156/g.93598 Transcript_29156/m.93598 type:complete len:116 (+) Transcript_29156:335-682(+)
MRGLWSRIAWTVGTAASRRQKFRPGEATRLLPRRRASHCEDRDAPLTLGSLASHCGPSGGSSFPLTRQFVPIELGLGEVTLVRHFAPFNLGVGTSSAAQHLTRQRAPLTLGCMSS